MDHRYPAYCIADPRYYEPPERARSDDGFAGYRDEVETPQGWHLLEQGQWIHCKPPGADVGELPTQGWKIHVSGTLDNAEKILKLVSSRCFEYGLAFKFLASPTVLLMRNAKYAPRESSGKFITLYPRDEADLLDILQKLDTALDGLAGPYILSDLRWNQGPLHVRYGAFVRRYTYGDDGALTPAIEDPDGRLVPDRREPRFVVPQWVRVPAFLEAAAALRSTAPQPDDFPFEVLDVMHFSNGGGVYRVRRRADGLEVVLKEARPYAGLDRRGRDAVTRLRAERAALSALHGIPGVPRVHDYLSLGEHEFMVMDHVPGISLHAWLSRNYRNLRRPGDSGAAAGYLDAARQIMEQVRTTLTAIHDRGYAFNDLHPGNIMVDDDLIVSLIDFEAAAPCEVARTLGAPGFAAPDTLRGAEADRYSLGAVELFLYVPLSSLLSLCPAKATTFIAHARSQIGLAEETADELTASLTVPGTPPSGLRPADLELEFVSVDGPWDRHMAAIGASILASATPDRTDRLFPGDINQFLHGGGGVAFGAAGVIEALHAAGYGDLDPFLDWLETCTRHDSAPRLGLYDGLAGVCRALFEHGRTEAALRLYDRGAENLGKMRGVKLYDGLSGIGLVDLDFHRRTGDLAFLERAGRAAAAVASAIESGAFIANAALSSATSSGGDRRGNAVENFRGGLLYGWSGLALFMLHMYELDGERRWLNAARQAIQRDIDQCKEMPDGTLQMRNGGRVLPYLATGSAGVAIVADRFLRHAADDRLADAVPALCRASATELCIGSGLFNGMAGLIYTLRHMAPRLDWPDMGQLLDRAVQALNLFCLADERGLAFPGEQNLRASADLATGSAGVLRLLALLVGRTAEILPFLTAPSMERR